jgi:hypothetical protein
VTTLVVGDVHGCSAELEELVARAQADSVILVGDLFTKGPDPLGVYRLIRSNNWRCVLGNHDLRLLRYLDGERPSDKGARACAGILDSGGTEWREWLRSLPLVIEAVSGFTVVHAGLHPSGELAKTTRDIALFVRGWPMDASEAAFWYQQYVGERRVIFGHDARRGLVRVEREGAPWLIGLDTGCVYGGSLSGYLVETDRLVSVPAARVYCEPNG